MRRTSFDYPPVRQHVDTDSTKSWSVACLQVGIDFMKVLNLEVASQCSQDDNSAAVNMS